MPSCRGSLGEEVCRQFRLGYAPGGPTLARRALQEGFNQDELRAAGLVRQRGDDYFSRRLLQSGLEERE